MAKIPTGGDDTSIEEEDEIIPPTGEQDEDEDIDDTTDDDGDEGDGDDAELTPEELQAQLKKAKEIAKNQRIRAEKAESKLDKGKTSKGIPSSKKESSALSTDDVFVLVSASIPRSDIPDVQKHARLNGMTIEEALADPFLKSYLTNKAEERKTADAVHVGVTRKTSGKKTSTQMLAEAQAGNMPDDPTALAEARLAAKRAKGEHRKR